MTTRRVRAAIAAATRAVVALLLDDACAGCGSRLDGLLGPTCSRCARQLLPESGRCRRCSLPAASVGRTAAETCPTCEGRPEGLEIAAPFAHRGPARALVLALKHGRRPELAAMLARASIVDPQARHLLEEAEALVPVPADPRRRRQRGFDQAEVLALALQRLARGRGHRPRVVRALSRRWSAGAQSGRSGRARRRALRGAFRSRPLAARRIRGRRVLLVDDVVTTGASLAEASRVLRRLGASEVTAFACTRSVAPPGGTP